MHALILDVFFLKPLLTKQLPLKPLKKTHYEHFYRSQKHKQKDHLDMISFFLFAILRNIYIYLPYKLEHGICNNIFSITVFPGAVLKPVLQYCGKLLKQLQRYERTLIVT